jgi:hypothetical protein
MLQVKCSEWSNKLVDAGNGSLVLYHSSGPRVAHALPYNSTSKPCTRISFDNGDDWCKAEACGAAPPMPPSPPPTPPSPQTGATYA